MSPRENRIAGGIVESGHGRSRTEVVTLIVAVVTTLAGLLVALVAYYRDDEPLAPSAPLPTWGLVPDPADIRRVSFPLSFPGYDPATVEVHLEALARAYGDLLAVAPPEVVAGARRRAALRSGVASDDVPEPPADTTGTTALTVPGVPVSPDDEALRTEAALAEIDER